MNHQKLSGRKLRLKLKIFDNLITVCCQLLLLVLFLLLGLTTSRLLRWVDRYCILSRTFQMSRCLATHEDK